MVLTMIPGTALAAEPSIIISNAKAHPGQNVEITVELVGNPGITSIDFFLQYDATQIELLKKQNGKLLEGTINSQTMDKNPYYCGWINSLQTTNCTDDGTLITLTFKVKDGAMNGKQTISFTEGKVTGYDANIRAVKFETQNGYIEIAGGSDEPVLPGISDGGKETPGETDEPKQPAKPITPAQPAGDGNSQSKKLTAKQLKTIEKVQTMKVVVTSAKYNKTKNTYTLKYKKTNKNYQLDGYQVLPASAKASNGSSVHTESVSFPPCRDIPGKTGSSLPPAISIYPFWVSNFTARIFASYPVTLPSVKEIVCFPFIAPSFTLKVSVIECRHPCSLSFAMS